MTVISSNVLRHDVPPTLEGSTDGIVKNLASQNAILTRACHSYTQGLAMLNNFCVVG